MDRPARGPGRARPRRHGARRGPHLQAHADAPDTGPCGRDNAFQGSSVTIDWAWATESVGPPATPTPTATPRPPAPAPRRRTPPRHARAPAAGPRRAAAGAARPAPARARHARDHAVRQLRPAVPDPFSARVQTSPLARASARTLLRRRVFRCRRPRRLPSKGAAERRIRLRLTPRAVRTLKRTLHLRGRVAVVIVARVRGPAAGAHRHPPDRAQARGAQHRGGRPAR